MKIVLSRKGFDSSAGGCPSPVFDNNRFLSLPIPDKHSPVFYKDLEFEGLNVGELVSQLTGNTKRKEHRAHLDPDLDPHLVRRQSGWRPSLGQMAQAQAHLHNQGVSEGDLFLFFGLFQGAEKINGTWRFKRKSRRFHAIWGWLQIGEVRSVNEQLAERFPWVRTHPHWTKRQETNNVLYIGRDRLDLGPARCEHSGAGVFPQLNEALRLTAEGSHKASSWKLPAFFYPDEGRPPLSFHRNLDKWQKNGEQCSLQSASRGQEFVLDAEHYPEAASWAYQLITNNSPL